MWQENVGSPPPSPYPMEPEGLFLFRYKEKQGKIAQGKSTFPLKLTKSPFQGRAGSVGPISSYFYLHGCCAEQHCSVLVQWLGYPHGGGEQELTALDESPQVWQALFKNLPVHFSDCIVTDIRGGCWGKGGQTSKQAAEYIWWQEEAALGRTFAASNPQSRPSSGSQACCINAVTYLLTVYILQVQYTDTVSHLHNVIKIDFHISDMVIEALRGQVICLMTQPGFCRADILHKGGNVIAEMVLGFHR